MNSFAFAILNEFRSLSLDPESLLPNTIFSLIEELKRIDSWLTIPINDLIFNLDKLLISIPSIVILPEI